MTDIETMLARLEATHAEMKRDIQTRRQLTKAMRYTGQTRRGANFGKAGVRHVSEQPIDLVKAQLTLNHLHRTGKLTDEQAGKAQARLMALRPTEIIRLK